jgi:flavin reductase (DIM6/NTAB) family NADH-FMN oxidoreductase RutF
MKKKNLPLSQVYRLIEPGPVTMVTTFHKGKANVMTMSWHMMIDFAPPILACIVSDQNYTFGILKQSKECVINIPTLELAKKAVEVGNVSGSKVDKFKKFNLKHDAGAVVNAPLLSDCYANFECKVIDMKLAGKYNMFILEVVKAWIRPSKKRPLTIHHCGKGTFVVDGKTIKLSSKKK